MSDYDLVPIPFLRDLQQIIATFINPAKDYLDTPTDQYHRMVARAQDSLSTHAPPSLLATHLPLGGKLVQSNIYLRAARPTKDTDAVGWHRESFYGAPSGTVNVWIPVFNVVPENSIQYIPGSTDIPNEDITTVPDDRGAVEKLSDAHRIGLLYAPKRIVSGVDLSKAQPFDVPIGQAAIFSGALIHGAAKNNTDKIRISVDFRAIARQDLKDNKPHFGKPYFTEVNDHAT